VSDREVNSALNDIDKKVQFVLDMTAEKIAGVAKDLCVVGQYTDGRVGGRLSGSISWSDNSKIEMYKQAGQGTGATGSDKVDKAPDRNTRWIGTNVDYAAHVEFGTGGRGESTAKSGFGAIIERSEKISSGRGGVDARPYLRPAAKEAPRILKQVTAQVKGISGKVK